jgi:RNA polymerase sigma factor (sigma-70 family)
LIVPNLGLRKGGAKMSKKEKEITVKDMIGIIQSEEYNEFSKQDSMIEILNMFEPFRRSLTKKFAGKGIEFDDVCQVIDLKLIEAMYDYDESLDDSAIRHITSRARNGIFNFYKKEMNYFREDRKTVSLESLSSSHQIDGFRTYILDSYAHEYNTFDTQFDEDKIVEKIMIEQGLENLTDHQKDLIFMYYMSDMTQEEIADELQINQANVSRATKRGVKKLRESFNSLDGHGDTF